MNNTPPENGPRPWVLDFTPDASGLPDLPTCPAPNPDWHDDYELSEWDPALHSVRASIEFARQASVWEAALDGALASGKIPPNPLDPNYPNVGKKLLDWQKTGPGGAAGAKAFIAEELDYLMQLMQEDRDRYMPELLAQADGAPGYWISLMRLDRGQYPWTLAVMSIALRIGEMVAMHYKDKFKRARPSTLCPALLVPFGPPLHPAFPSGHATQSALMSLLLVRVSPYVKRHYAVELGWLASRVAKGRERAGLHYPSDSYAGWLLAKKVDDMYGAGTLTCTVLDDMLANAQNEWP